MREIELEEEERREMLEAQKMKGKKFKKPQPIKLREIPEIIQPDYAEKNGLVYHIDRITMLSDAVFKPPPETKPTKEKSDPNSEQSKEEEKLEV